MKPAFDVTYRRKKLQELLACIEKRIGQIESALEMDLGKPAFEARVSETGYIIRELRLFIRNISIWAKPKRLSASWLNFPSKNYILPVPYGKVLVFAPWNYPFQLSLSPAIAAFASGNSVVLKPSELAMETEKIIVKIISEVFSPEEISVETGGADKAKELLGRKWDYIFYTGGTAIGKEIYQKAAENLTPVTLELGGKNPCIVLADADLKLAAKRIVWGKFFNAGQTCIAPDFVLAEASVKDELLKELVFRIGKFYSENPESSRDFGRMIDEKKTQRLEELIRGAKIICGGVSDIEKRYFAPTVVDLEDETHRLMDEEIFGPILPVIAFDSEADLEKIISKNPDPLAFYVFSSDEKKAEKIMASYRFGGGCINDCIVHFATDNLPFGGVGNSGIGAYHGKFGFDTFSHRKSILVRGNWMDPDLRYPPYKSKLGLMEKILKWL